MITIYIDFALLRYIERHYGSSTNVEDIIEHCGYWDTFTGLKNEYEDEDITLEELLSDHYFIVEDNKVLFTSAGMLLDDIDEYIKG